MQQNELALRHDLASLSFKVGERRNKWKLCGLKFPFALFSVTAAHRPESPEAFLLRVDCTGYPASAPTSQLWHGALDAALPEEQRPHDAQGVLLAFKQWQPCLYHPVDRIALEQHSDWQNQHSDKIWTPAKNIIFLLETVYDLLHSTEYLRATVSPGTLNVPAAFVE